MSNDETHEHDERAAIRQALAAELRAAVARADLTQGEVAERTGLHRVTVNRLLSGQRGIDVDQLFAFAFGLDLDPGELVDAAKRKYLEERARLHTED
ncbi:helix-turn-helix domain-containing protein [Nocardia farcinica]|uniref:helix-turn-helix domain-containing protein n=1 Tax=Nocardia farcinica TaxID=37329 RepID=UPI002457B6BE|nr:helix-turn-helix transcriptional regulator [Nocardia farcinica]